MSLTLKKNIEPKLTNKYKNNDNHSMPVDRGYAWVVLIAVFLIHVLYGSIVRSLGIISAELVELYDVKKGQASYVVSGLFGVFLISSPLAAYLCRNLPHRFIISVGSILCCLGFSSVSILQDFYSTMVVLGSLTGFGMALFHCAAVAVLTDYFHHYRGVSMSMLFSGSASGAFLGPFLLHSWCDQYGTRNAMLLFGGILLHICVFGTLMLPKSFFASDLEKLDPISDSGEERECDLERSQSIDTDTPLTAVSKGISNQHFKIRYTLDHILDLELLKIKEFWLIAPAIALFSLSATSYFFLIANYGRDIHLTSTQITTALIVHGAADIFWRGGIGFVSDLGWISRPVLATIFLFCHALTWLLCGQVTSLNGLLLVSFGQALFGGSNFGTITAVLSDVVSLRHVSTAYAYCLFLEGILNFIIPTVIGSLRDGMGNWSASFWIFCGLNIISGFLFIILILRINKLKKKLQQTEEMIADPIRSRLSIANVIPV